MTSPRAHGLDENPGQLRAEECGGPGGQGWG